MNILRKIMTILFILFAVLLGISSFLTGRYLQIIPILLIIITFIPVTKKFLKEKIETYSSRTHILILLFLLVCYFSAAKLYLRDDIFRSAEQKEQITALYDEFLKEWPVDTKSRMIGNSFGKIHVLVSGQDTAPALVLIPAENMSAVSWEENIRVLNKHFHCYAIDQPGEAGKSQLTDLNNYPKTEQELVRCYREILDSLKIKNTSLVAASTGGRTALLLAAYIPQRINKVALIGPMGINKPSPEFIWKTILTSMYPFSSIRRSTAEWTIGTADQVTSKYGPWYDQVLKGTVPHTAYPMALSSGLLGKIQTPVLLVLGTNDNLAGKPGEILEKAKRINHLQYQVLPSSHLIAIEEPEKVNQLLDIFLNQK